ncbi:MAG: tyrosine-type recombinase/integrase, partial [Candidatus Anammoxibacter sp.]
VKEGLISNNPCSGFKPLKVSKSRDRILSGDEINTVLDAPEGKERLMMVVSLFTGMRLNGVLLLKWTDIDFDNRLITFTQSKTGKVITTPLSEYLSAELIKFRCDPVGDRVFESNKPITVLVLLASKRFSKLFKSLGIENFTFHNLRHTFASLHCSVGTDIITTQNLLGHSDVSQTMRYSHSQFESKRNAIDNITDRILGTTGKASIASI